MKFTKTMMGGAAVVAVAALALTVPALASPSSHAQRAAPAALTCYTTYKHFQDKAYTVGFSKNVSGTFELTKIQPPTNMCALDSSSGYSDTRLKIYGTSNCLTYAGPAGGGNTSYLYPLACTTTYKASQAWTWDNLNGDILWNDYTGSKVCVENEGANYVVQTRSCDGGADQKFVWG
jgi:hypothetical protein